MAIKSKYKYLQKYLYKGETILQSISIIYIIVIKSQEKNN